MLNTLTTCIEAVKNLRLVIKRLSADLQTKNLVLVTEDEFEDVCMELPIFEGKYSSYRITELKEKTILVREEDDYSSYKEIPFYNLSDNEVLWLANFAYTL